MSTTTLMDELTINYKIGWVYICSLYDSFNFYVLKNFIKFGEK